MELEEKVSAHDDAIRRHDKEIGRLSDDMANMQKSLNEGLSRVDESNKFLREQNTRQSEQNAQILQAVLQGNQDKEKRKYDLEMLNKSNIWKLILGIGASAGTVFAFIMQLLHFFGGR